MQSTSYRSLIIKLTVHPQNLEILTLWHRPSPLKNESLLVLGFHSNSYSESGKKQTCEDSLMLNFVHVLKKSSLLELLKLRGKHRVASCTVSLL